MSDCECLPKCIFFNDKMAKYPTTAEGMKNQYCRTDKTKCARYFVSTHLGPGAVPEDLYPDEMKKAKEIIFNKKTEA